MDVWGIHEFKLGGNAAVLASSLFSGSLYLAVLKHTSNKTVTEKDALHTARTQIKRYAKMDPMVASLPKGQCTITMRRGGASSLPWKMSTAFWDT